MKAIMILAAAMMMTTQAADAQTEKKLTNFNDTTFTLNEVTVKSSLPKSRVKGDAMRTIINGTILEKAGKATDCWSAARLQSQASRHSHCRHKGTGAGKSQKDRM